MIASLTAIIIDDERPAQEELLDMLNKFAFIKVVAICKNAMEGKKEIERFKPDIVFLDISMPQESGLEMLKRLNFTPFIIFVTAFDNYAIRAFEENALDYLLKPVSEHRLEKTIERIQEKIKHNVSDLKRIFIRDKNQYIVVSIGGVYLIESYGNYIKLYYNDKFVIQPNSLKEVIEWIPTQNFIQINRTQIVNINFIEYISQKKRNLQIRMSGKSDPLEVAYRRSSEFKNHLSLRIDKIGGETA